MGKLNVSMFEAIRHIYCMDLEDFKNVFGKNLGDHLFFKLKEEKKNDVAKWLCDLDLSNQRLIVDHLNSHLNSQIKDTDKLLNNVWASKRKKLTDLQRFDRAKWAAELLNDFKIVAMDNIMTGVSDGVDDHSEFLMKELEEFLEALEEVLDEKA